MDNSSLFNYFHHPIELLKEVSCLPYLGYLDRIESNRTDEHSRHICLDDPNELRKLLFNSTWIDKDIEHIACKIQNGELESNIGQAFSLKYGQLSPNDDARSVAPHWISELQKALAHLNPNSLLGDILHIGADDNFEPSYLHKSARSVILCDISKAMLQKAMQKTDYKSTILGSAENLNRIHDRSINLYIALRVFCATGFNYKMAIEQAASKLRTGGSILLSVSNGYKSMDNTILPGQISGSPYKLDLSKPYEIVKKLLENLYLNGFTELFVVPGSCEIFLGGTNFRYKTFAKNAEPVVHVDSNDHIPICFYSESTPTGWLGNFSNHSICVSGQIWPTAEHYFQSLKFESPLIRQKIREIDTPIKAKEFAWENHRYELKHWNLIKLDVMRTTLDYKFTQHTHLKTSLNGTGKREIVERSNSDEFWGKTVSDKGMNYMGKLLMDLRDN